MNDDNRYEKLIHSFYQSFQQRHAEGMIACYHPEIVFYDPAFGHLHGEHAGNMWRMLNDQADDSLIIRYSDVKADEHGGAAHWEADYPFSKTGRTVHNKIKATFAFKDNLIVRHTDDFSLWKWSSMALGLPGLLLGWSPMMKNKIRSQALKSLSKYESSKI